MIKRIINSYLNYRAEQQELERQLALLTNLKFFTNAEQEQN